MNKKEELDARIEENFRKIDALMQEIRDAEAKRHQRRLVVWLAKQCTGISVCYFILMYFFH